MQFQRLWNLTRHEKACIKSCKSCQQVIAIPMAEHLKSCPALKCVKCEQQIRQDKYISHNKSCKGKLKACRLCKTVFKSALELVKHLETCGKFLCIICDQEFPTKKELNTHKKEHGGKRKTGDRSTSSTTNLNYFTVALKTVRRNSVTEPNYCVIRSTYTLTQIDCTNGHSRFLG